jgi:hypothetical protein
MEDTLYNGGLLDKPSTKKDVTNVKREDVDLIVECMS